MALSTNCIRFVPTFTGQSCGPNEAKEFLTKAKQLASQNKWDESNTIIGFEIKLEMPVSTWWYLKGTDNQ